MKNKRAKLRKLEQQNRCIKHTMKRAWQRYGLKLSRDDVIHMSTLIKKGGLKKIAQTTNSKKIYYVPVRDSKIMLPCVYCTVKQVILTVLEVDWIVEGQGLPGFTPEDKKL